MQVYLTPHDDDILTVLIDCKGQRIYSAGASSRILYHDLQTGDEEGSFDGLNVREDCCPTNEFRNFGSNLFTDSYGRNHSTDSFGCRLRSFI